MRRIWWLSVLARYRLRLVAHTAKWTLVAWIARLAQVPAAEWTDVRAVERAALRTWLTMQAGRLQPNGERRWRAWKRAARSVPDIAPWPTTFGDPVPVAKTREWFGTIHDPYPAPDHDRLWFGTAAGQPYPPPDHGRR